MVRKNAEEILSSMADYLGFEKEARMMSLQKFKSMLQEIENEAYSVDRDASLSYDQKRSELDRLYKKISGLQAQAARVGMAPDRALALAIQAKNRVKNLRDKY